MKNARSFIAALIAAVIPFSLSAKQAPEGEVLHFIPSISPVELTCEYLTNPMGIDVSNPRLSWKLAPRNSQLRNIAQERYRLEVASSERTLKQGKADLWDVNIKSDETTQIEYEGEALKYPSTCWWRVKVADKNGAWSTWSEPAYWVTGPMEDSDWNASWIGCNETFTPSKDKENPGTSMSDPWFRRVYTLETLPTNAMLYVASCGYHEVYINGVRVGDEVLSPSVSNLSKRALYKTYNITPYLQEGDNCIAFWLGVGWSGYTNYKTDAKPMTPMVIAQADLFYPGKDTPVWTQWTTDDTWKTHPSPNALQSIWHWNTFGGELYDAQKELPNWNQVEFDDSGWNCVKVYEPNLKISANNVEGNKIVATLKPMSIEKQDDGTVRVDMGRNFTGWLEAKVKGEAGKRVDFYWSEREDKMTSFSQKSTYIFGEAGGGTFCNRFNYHTGRWITIVGLDYVPTTEELTGYFITTKYARAGQFKCDKALYNDIYDTAMWTFQNLSLGGYVVDCPHRERMGYGGDGNATIDMGMANFSLGALYYKWARDWRDVQNEDGFVNFTAPTYWGAGGPTWSGFILCMPWKQYLQYGDIRVLQETYPAIQKWMEYLCTNEEDGLLETLKGAPTSLCFLGDWLRPGSTGGTAEENACLNNCYWVYALETTAKVADVLGYVTDAEKYRAKASEVRNVINAKFYDEETGKYVSGLEAYQAMALLAEVPEKEETEKVWKALEDVIKSHDGKIHAGITGGAFLFKLLQKTMRNDLIAPMVNTSEYPGWGDMLKQGATTFWEDWEGDASKNHSCLHSSYLYVGNWFLEGLGGIHAPQSAEQSSFKHFVLTPGDGCNYGVNEVNSSYDSIRGKIICSWQIRHNKMFVRVVIPPGCTADVIMPATLDKCYESAHAVGAETRGLISADADSRSLTLSSGTYSFEIWLR